MRHKSPRAALAAAAAAAALVVGAAMGAERFLGIVPCALCLLERWPWRVAVVVAVAGLLVPRRLGWIALALAGFAVAVGAVFAATHVGVEAHFWPSPLPECATPPFAGGSVADMLAHLPARPAKPCDAPTYIIPWLPVSTAMMNLLASLAYVGWIWRAVARHRSSWR